MGKRENDAPIEPSLGPPSESSSGRPADTSSDRSRDTSSDRSAEPSSELSAVRANEQRLIAIAADAEARYLHVQQLLTSFLGNMPALSFIKDDAGRYLYASKSFAEFFEVKPEQFLGKTDFEWLPRDIAQQFSDNDNLVRKTGEPIELIERAPKNGQIIESIVQKFPIHIDSAEGKRLFVGGIALDITERIKAQERIEELAEDLERLTHGISHELQEPVNTVKSYQSLLAARYKDRLGDDADSFIQKCSDAANTIERMVNDLWTFARVGKHASFSNIDSARALGTAIERLAKSGAGGGGGAGGGNTRNAPALTYRNLPTVFAIEEQVAELFERLILNAMQNCSGACEVTITTKRMGEAEEFCFADNGTGLDPMDAKEMFKLFRRGGLRHLDASGSGMGLPICARIVKHHRGTIRIESEPGSGTKIFFTLPAERQ